MSMTEKIRIMLVKRKMSAVDLAKILECSPTNIYNNLKRDNFSKKELKQIADILNCDFKGIFVMRDTKEVLIKINKVGRMREQKNLASRP